MRTKIRSTQRLSPGTATIQIDTGVLEPKPGSPLSISCLDIGTCFGGPVSDDYYDRAPFPFNGRVNNVNIRYTT